MSDTIKPKPNDSAPSASGSAPEGRLPTDSLRLVLQLEDTDANRFIMEQAHETIRRTVIPEVGHHAILKLEQIRLTAFSVQERRVAPQSQSLRL